MWAAIGWDVTVAAVPVAAAAVGAVIGVAHIPWLALLLAGAGIAAVAVCIERALKARQLAARSGWLAIGLLAALLLPLGALTYHQWFDPAARTPQTYQFVVNGGETQVLQMAGEAGGEPQVLVEGLIGGRTYICLSAGRSHPAAQCGCDSPAVDGMCRVRICIRPLGSTRAAFLTAESRFLAAVHSPLFPAQTRTRTPIKPIWSRSDRYLEYVPDLHLLAGASAPTNVG